MSEDLYGKIAAEAVDCLNKMAGAVYQTFTEDERRRASERVLIAASMHLAMVPAVRLAARAANPSLSEEERMGLVMESTMRAIAGSFRLDPDTVIENARKGPLRDYKPPRDPSHN